MTLYSASKYAWAHYRRLRMELRRDNIKAMLVLPRIREDRFQQHVMAGQAPDA